MTRLFGAVCLLASCYSALAQVVCYEGTDCLPDQCAAPLSPAWTRVGTFDAQRWLENGLLCQYVVLGVWSGPHGQNDAYQRSLADYSGSTSFFLAWRNITDCPAADIDGTPVVVSAASSGSCLFHFTMTSSEVRFIRDNTLALILYLDITPDVFHTYYLALHGDLSYEWYIDANIVNSGQYPAAYPISDANLIWAARYYKDNQTTKWDYIRYGVVPADHSGDFDSNGLIDSTDVYYFVDCLLGPDYDAAGPGCKWADMNADGKADGADIQLFVHAMTGG